MPDAAPHPMPSIAPDEPPAASPLACLTVLLPSATEDRLVDWLLARDGAPIEFSVHAVAARGPLVRLAPGDEQVRGHAQRVEVKLIAPRLVIDGLTRDIARLMAGTPGGYWVMPVERFAAFDAPPAAPGARA